MDTNSIASSNLFDFLTPVNDDHFIQKAVKTKVNDEINIPPAKSL
jgi:hypothetical protein